MRKDARVSGMREFWRALPTEGRWLLSTVAIQTLGRGLTLPFTIIYLHEVRGFDLALSGTLMGLIAVVGLIVTGPGGILIDRFGARPVLIVGLVCMVLGCTLLAYATHPAVAAAGLILIGVNFGVNFALVNLGIGVGGIVGGFYVNVAEPETFTVIFLINAASSLIPMALLLGPLRHVRTQSEPSVDESERGGYRQILRRPAVIWVSLLTFVAMFVGYGQMEAGFPAFARQISEVSTRTIGFAFAANTVVIVLLQFAVLKRIAGRRRTRVMWVMALVWAASWLLLGATGLLPDTLAAAIGVIAFMGVFAFGETLLQPTVPAVYNDLASDHTRGRYNAINSAAFQGGAITGPIAAGVLLDNDLPAVFIGLMVVCCLGIGVMALALERRITPQVNGVVGAQPAVD